MKRIKATSIVLFLLVMGVVGSRSAIAATCATVASGQTASQINTLMTSCGSGNTLPFAAGGSWTISGTHLNIPCGLNVTGPVVAWPGPYTATFTSSLGSDWVWYFPGNCTTATSLQYVNVNGGDPANGGGGAVYIPASGGSNVTVQFNNFYGNQASPPSGSGQAQSSLIWLDGNSGDIWTGLNISWNFLGSAATNDCSNVMSLYNYYGANYDSSGGQCAGMGIHSGTTNFVFAHNVISHQEQGMKFYEGSGQSNPCPVSTQICHNNSLIQYNDFSGIHRIVIEAQSTPAPNMFFQYNDVHDQINPGFGSWQFSIPQYANNGESINTYGYYNVMIGNVPATSAGGGYFPSAFELWGTGAANYNLVQGYMACGIDWGYGASPWSISNNVIQVVAGNTYICNEENQSNPPTMTGNQTSNTISVQTSVTPAISPASGTFTGSQTVTLGLPSGIGPRDANTGIWYCITSGCTPSPGGSGSIFYTAPFTVTQTTTVKAVGMWGSQNQPTSYPAGYGYVPSAVMSATYTGGTSSSFFLSPTGSDSNNGTSASTPWLTPNHAMTCGQTITAAAGTYSSANFQSGNWGTVSCPAGNNVAWLTCATFDACKITATGSDAMWISKPFWGVQGWETSTNTTQDGACFHIGSGANHIIMANDVANGCMGGGFNAYGTVDYVVYIGDIAYNAAGGNNSCYSGFNVYEPVASDTATGTHMYMAGNFSFDNVDGTCTDVTDGEGLNFDTFDGDQGGHTSYKQQAAMENNIAVFNGSSGILQENNCNNSSAGNCPSGTVGAPSYFEYNTTYGNITSTNEGFCGGKGEIYMQNNSAATVMHNLAQTATANGSGSCSTEPIYAMSVANSNSGVVVSGNWFAGVNPTNADSNTGFSYGSNVTGTSAAFSNPVKPGAPSCGGTANVPACMATLIANFTPTTAAAKAYGYQTPSSTNVYDLLYPQWLCGVNLPAGLVTPGCASAPTLQSGYQGNATNANTQTVGQPAIQQIAYGQFSSPSTPQALPYGGQTASWSSSNTAVLNVSSTGLVTCVGPATGTATANSLVTAQPSGVVFNGWGWTCSAASSVTLTGVSLSCAGGAATVGVGASLVCTATCSYSNSTNTNCSTADSHGTDASFLSSNTAAATVNASGTVTGVAAGTTNLTTTAGAFTSSPPLAITVTAPAPVLQGVTLTTGGTSSLTVGQTLQTGAQCNYSGGINTTCYPTADQYQTLASGFSSSQPTVATMSTSGLVSAVASGATNLTVKANSFTSSPVSLTVNALPPPATITGVTITGPNTVVAGSQLTLGAQCSYSDGSTTSCQTVDSHGNVASGWTSSIPARATVASSTGVVTGVAAGPTAITAKAGSGSTIFTSPAFTVTVTAVPATSICGNNQQNLSGAAGASYVNSTYCVTGTNTAGYNAGSGSFFLPAGTVAVGANWDLLVTVATSGSAQATAPTCVGTYTSTSTTSPAAWVTVSLVATGTTSACHLSPSTAYWIGVNPSGNGYQFGFFNCGGGTSGCAGSLPTAGQNAGTYPFWYISQVYGSYAGNGTAMIESAGQGGYSGGVQGSEYVTLTSPPPSLTGGYQQSSPTQGVNQINVGGTILLAAYCQYSDGSSDQCFPAPDVYGNTILACTSSNTAVLTVIAATSGNNPCLVTGVSGGKAAELVTLTGGVLANEYVITSQSYDTQPVPGSPTRFFRR